MLRVLMMVSWYEDYYSTTNFKGIFHNEFIMFLKERCKVALFFPYDQSITEDMTVRIENGIITYRTHFKRSKKAKNIVNAMRGALKVVKEFKPDIIHAHVASNVGVFAIVIGQIYKIPVIITEHLSERGMNLDVKRNIFINDYIYKKSDMNICVSSYQMEELSRRFKNRKFMVIYNGTINPEKFIDSNRKYRIEGYINFAIVGGFYSKDIKGYQYLLPAIKKLVKYVPNVKLHIVGGGKYLSFYKKMAKELIISKECIFYDFCDRKKTYTIISQMDFCVSASLYESAGVFIQESMMLGKPMVVTKSGGADSLVNKEAAIIVDTQSEDGLCDGIRMMCNNYMNYNCTNIKKYGFDNFEMTHIVDKYIKLYENILRKRK